jgi:phenylalanyl-tRNA synthetase beta chain
MKVSYSWVKEYINFDLSINVLAEKLTMVGLEVEEIISCLPDFNGIIVAKILAINKHPNADRLSICEVQTGKEKYQVICGAPNIRVNQKVAFAPVGTILPNKVKIKKTSIRGIDSHGMICSKQELCMEDKSKGIWELPHEWETSMNLHDLLAVSQDYILEISITPNRPDAMSIIGIAREIAAITKSKYKIPEINLDETVHRIQDEISIEIKNPAGCPRYTARVIKDLKIKESPYWLKDRLEKCGIRPINNIVDVTNYVLLESGQPLHAFDLDKISNKKIVVKDSLAAEKFITLDGKDRILPEKTVMICDADKAVAVGGIMGGYNSEVTDNTKDILLESAYFTPERIAYASNRLNLSTEASQRFERGIDPNGVIWAINRAAVLLHEIAGGKVLKGVLDIYPKQILPKQFRVRHSRINMLLGTELTEKEISKTLEHIDLHYQNEIITVPTFRPDLEREVDIIEEVARLIGFDNIPTREKLNINYSFIANKTELFHSYIKNQIQQLGFTEVITNSMLSSKELEKIKDPATIKILNPVSDDMNIMRCSLIPGLLKVITHNIHRNLYDLRIFEIGRVFYSTDAESQPYIISGLIHGRRELSGWEGDNPQIDFYDLKGIVESFITKISLDKYEFILYDTSNNFDKDQSIKILVKGDIIGQFGRINIEIAKFFDIENDIFGFEFFVEKLRKYSNQNKLYEPYSKYPYVEKDLCFVIDYDIHAERIRQDILKIGKPLVTDVIIFDVFQNKQLGINKKSIAFRIQFQSKERTLQDKEVNTILKKILNYVKHKYQAKLR